MATFFSGTDTSTLQEEGTERNHFLSLIVNNEGTYSAAITRKIKVDIEGTKKLSYNTFNDAVMEYNSEPYICSKEFIEYYFLDIEKPTNENTQDELNNRLEELKAKTAPTLFHNSFGRSSSEPFYPTPYTPIFKDVPKTDKKVPEDVVDKLVKSLITGNVFAPLNTNLDLKAWGKNMVPLYNRIFKTHLSKDFEYYLTNYIDTLYSLYNLNQLNATETFDLVNAIIDKLDKMEENAYLNEIKKIVQEWI